MQSCGYVYYGRETHYLINHQNTLKSIFFIPKLWFVSSCKHHQKYRGQQSVIKKIISCKFHEGGSWCRTQGVGRKCWMVLFQHQSGGVEVLEVPDGARCCSASCMVPKVSEVPELLEVLDGAGCCSVLLALMLLVVHVFAYNHLKEEIKSFKTI